MTGNNPSFLNPIRRSLSKQVFMQILLVIFFGGIVIGFVTFLSVSKIVNTEYDQRLILGTNLLANLMRDELREIRLEAKKDKTFEVDDDFILSAEDRRAFDAYANWRMFRIWYNGTLALASDTGPHTSKHVKNISSGFSLIKSGDEEWKVYSLNIPNSNALVQVGERMKIRKDLVDKISLKLGIPIAIIGIILLIILWFAIKSGLNDLGDFTTFLVKKETRPPFKPIILTDWPVELSHLISVINDLFSKVEYGIIYEREFIERAAHQLRTPIASLSLEAQICQKISDKEEIAKRLKNLNYSTERLARLIDQLLDFAQLEAYTLQNNEKISLRKHIEQSIATLAIIAAQKGVSFGLEGECDACIEGSAFALELLLSNFLSNAVKYTKPNSEIILRIINIPEKNQIKLEIIDNGRGIKDEDKAIAFEKFWQENVTKNNNYQGSGLGLSIAKRAANILNCDIALMDRTDNLEGLRVIIVFKL